jgi:shikimate dehydrogenase
VIVGLIGDPVAHSASPRMQGAAFAHTGLNWRYELWHTVLADLPARMAEIRSSPEIAGCNVTIPHKQHVVPYLDVVSPHAQAIGAVNTVVKQPNGALHGDNTDWLGFLADLRFHGVDIAPMRNKTALVFGAGGSARGIVYALLMRGLHVAIHNRDAARATALAGDMQSFGPARSIASDALHTLSPALIVNCTSAGMDPHADTSPWPAHLPFPSHSVLYDLVYKPRNTRLMRQAETAGTRAIGGIGMLVEQGAAAFELWTRQPAGSVSAVMREVLA